MANVSRKRSTTHADADAAPREITAQPREVPPDADATDVYAALPDFVLVCHECDETEPAPADAALGDTFACAYCGEFAVVEEP